MENPYSIELVELQELKVEKSPKNAIYWTHPNKQVKKKQSLYLIEYCDSKADCLI